MLKPNAMFAIKLVVSAGLLAMLLFIADAPSVFQRLKGLRLEFFLLGFTILVGQVALSTVKWRVILAAENHCVPFLLLMRTYLIGNFLSLFLPTSFGGDIYRIAALRDRIATSQSAASVLFDRLTGLMALGTIGLMGSIAIWRSGAVVATAVIAFLLAAGGFFAITSDRLNQWLAPLSHKRYLKLATDIIGSFRTYRHHYKTMALCLLISLTFQLNIVLVNYFYTLALSLQIPFTVLLLIIPIAYLTEVLPFSVNGIGIRDSALVAMFLAFNYPADYGLSIGLLIIAGRYLLGVLGGVTFLGSVIQDRLQRQQDTSSDT